MDTDNVGVVSVGGLCHGKLKAWGPAVADNVCRLEKREGEGEKRVLRGTEKRKRAGAGAARARGA